MWQYTAKIAITALLIVAVSEIAKRNSFWAAALASLPITSLLAFIWLYVETGDTGRIAALSQGVFWLVLPSLVLFLALPLLLRAGWSFWPSLAAASGATAVAYAALIWFLPKVGVHV
jgi:hypothetical protein